MLFVVVRALTYAVIFIGVLLVFLPARLLMEAGVGASLTVAGAALFYQSIALLAYAAGFVLATHLFVTTYEERTLRKKFGNDYAYAAYCEHVQRWAPGRQRE